MVDGTNLPTIRNPKILGATFDNRLNFNKHCNKTCANYKKGMKHCNKTCVKLQKRNNVLKKLAGTSWGCSKETLSVTYKAIGWSVLNYAAPSWTPTLSYTNWQRLQVKQNNALRTTTG